MPKPGPDPGPAPDQPRYAIPAPTLQALVLALARPAADAPDAAWQAVVQDGLDTLAAFDPRDPIEALYAVQIIAANAAMLDAFRLGFAPDAGARQALRQRANAAALARVLAGAARLLKEQRAQPAAPARDWGDTAAALATGWQNAPARPAEAPRGGSPGAAAAAAEPETIIRWLDEVPDDELAEEVERVRREEAGEPPVPAKPGPRRIYQHKPDDYARRWTPDPKLWRPYPGWENMTLAQRREFFGYSYTGPGGPLEALSPAGQAAMLADQAEEAALAAEYGR